MSTEKRNWTAILIAAAIVAGGLVLGAILIWTGPTTQPEEKPAPSRIVRVAEVSPGTERISVTAYGPVIPARRVEVKPQVGGRIVRIHDALVPGGYIDQGEELIGIDRADYVLDLAEKESALEEARFEQAVETGRQVVARREWGLLESNLGSNEVNRSLVLREPHLRRTEAMIRSATNDIARAELALSRTSVPAPFNAMVLEETVERGQLVAPGSTIATLVGTDEFWVQAALPVSELRRIRLPGPDHAGAAAEVILDTGDARRVSWQGRVVRLLSDLEPTGRMARVLVRVEDPLGLAGGGRELPLLLGSYARVEIDAGVLEDVLVIPRSALREGERIWVVDGNNQLWIRDAEILWSREDNVLIRNILEPEEQLVLSGLRTALPGMKVDPQPLRPPDGSPPAGVNTNRIASGGPGAANQP